MSQKFDFVIIGAGCVGVAAAYYALKQDRTVCLLEKSQIGEDQKFWTESFITRQKRNQYNQEYLTRFARASHDEWRVVQEQLGKGKPFVYRQGALWFGDKHANSGMGNIKAAQQAISTLNANLARGVKKLPSLYIQSITQESPGYMKAFKAGLPAEWADWSSLYQPDGGSVDMKASYDAFYLYIKSRGDKAAIYDNTEVLKHEYSSSQFQHRFTTSTNKVIQGKTVLIATGVYTPHFLKQVMNYPHLVDSNFREGESNREYSIREYTCSYLKVEEGYEQLYSHLPTFVNFIKENAEEREFTAYGFPQHEWDTLKNGHFIKLGTMAYKSFESAEEQRSYLIAMPLKSLNQQDLRVEATISYASKRMNGINPKSQLNKHFPLPMIFYQGRETLLDYFQRKDESVVVQSGGWLAAEYPLLAKTAVHMLLEPHKVRKERLENALIGSFLNRTRFPIKAYVNDTINKLNYSYPDNGEFTTVVIGAGSAGIYAAYRLNKAEKEERENIGLFDLSQRISGGLKSFEIRGTETPIEVEEMRYIPEKHSLLNDLVTHLGIPNIPFLAEGERLEGFLRKPTLKNEQTRIKQRQRIQRSLSPSSRLKGELLGMSAYQIICFSVYQILTAPENLPVLAELFLLKTKDEISRERERARLQHQIFHVEDVYYRNWQNYVYQEKDNPLTHHINLTLEQWNRLRPILVYRFPYEVTDRDIFGQERVELAELYPLYKFGFQNVIEAQFGHKAYLFTAEHNGYYSNTSNTSYIDQVMIYLLDYGDLTYRTLVGGFDNLNYAMANELIDEDIGLPANEGGIYLSHKLVNIQKVNKRYLLTFHVKDANTPLPLEDPFKGQLLSGVSKSKLYNLVHKDLAVPVPLPGKQGFSSIQFIADRLILCIPKKAIQLLYKEIDLLQEPISTYEHFYRADRKHYQALLGLAHLKDEVRRIKKFEPLNLSENEEREKLLKKEEKHYRDPLGSPQISPNESRKLAELYERYFYNVVLMKPSIDTRYEQQKLKKFAEDAPIAPKNLFSLTQSTLAMPAMRFIMNFSRNWWDLIQRISEAIKKPTKSINVSQRIEEIRGISLSELTVRQTLHLSLGEDNILVFTYNDRISTEFWMALHSNFEKVWTPKAESQQELKSSPLKKIIAVPPHQNIYPAKEVLVKELLRELSRIHNMEVKEEWLKECVYQFWGNDQFGVGSHHFYSGYYIPSIMQSIRKPWKDESIHFVGEAFFNTSGWVQGAFQTTELLLQEEFGLNPLVKHYYAGY